MGKLDHLWSSFTYITEAAAAREKNKSFVQNLVYLILRVFKGSEFAAGVETNEQNHERLSHILFLRL